IAQDLLDFMDALGLDRVGLAGYDWGGRAACITAILAPERVQALVTIGGYNVQNTLAAQPPASARQDRALWYQWYFNTERGGGGAGGPGAASLILWGFSGGGVGPARAFQSPLFRPRAPFF